MQKRISWIDIARGIGILLVVYGHVFASDKNRFLIYSFHIPLFFFLSGIVFHNKHNQPVGDFIKKNIKTILLPYLYISLIQFVIWVTTNHPQNIFSLRIVNQLFGIFYASGSNGFLAFNSVLWFLPCLFVTKVGFGLLVRVVEKTNSLLVVLFLSSIIGYCMFLFVPKMHLPFQIETTFSAIVFFGTGFLSIKTGLLEKLLQKKLLLSFFITLFICLITATVNFMLTGQQIDMRTNRLNNYFLFYIGAFSGIYVTLLVSVLIRTNKLLEYVGKNSLTIYVWHPLILPMFTPVVQFISSINMLDQMKFVFAAFYTIITTTVVMVLNALFIQLKRLAKSYAANW